MKRSLPCTQALAALLLLAAACSPLAPREDRSRYFMLEPAAPGAAVAPGAELSVGLGPIQLPEYLKGPEMMTRTGPHELSLSTSDRWAEPLEAGLPRVLGANLERELGGGRVTAFPWYANEKPQFQIEADIDRFELEGGGRVVLDARWRVRRLAGFARTLDRETHASRAVGSGGSAAVAAALSACAADLSHEMADAVRSLAVPPERRD